MYSAHEYFDLFGGGEDMLAPKTIEPIEHCRDASVFPVYGGKM